MKTLFRRSWRVGCLALLGLFPLVAMAERELSIRAFSDEVRGRVVAKVAEALGDGRTAAAEIVGVVTFVGEDFLFLQRGDDGLKIECSDGRPSVCVGDVVSVSGAPSLEGGRILLRAKAIGKVGTEPLPEPHAATRDELVEPDAEGVDVNWLRVTVEGRAIGLSERGFVLDISGVPVNVMCADVPGFLSDSSHTHPKVCVSGVVEQLLDPSVWLGHTGFVMGVKLHAVGSDVTLVPDLSYLAARRTRLFIFGVSVVSAALAALLLVVAVLSVRQHRRLFRSRTLMAERKRMADDLHDTIEQHLVGAGMLMKLGRLKEAESVLVRAKREIRDIVWGLKNDDMMRLSPAELLRQLAHDENTKGLCRVDTRLAGLPPQMDAAQMRDLSLIVREAIGNAIKHGGAKKIALTTDSVPAGGWLLRLANDGTPFDPATAPGAAEGHFGLEGMRQRARRLGATLSFARRDGWTVLSIEKAEA